MPLDCCTEVTRRLEVQQKTKVARRSRCLVVAARKLSASALPPRHTTGLLGPDSRETSPVTPYASLRRGSRQRNLERSPLAGPVLALMMSQQAGEGMIPSSDDSAAIAAITPALEKLCPECIIKVRVNDTLNLIAVDTRNGQTTRTLLNCTSICGLKVTAYEPSSRSAAVGVIRDVETNPSDAEITENIRSTVRITRLRRLGASESVKINFAAMGITGRVQGFLSNLLSHRSLKIKLGSSLSTSRSRYHPRNVVVITDSRCALQRLLMCTETTTSRARIALQHMEANGFVVQFQWVPSHIGIKGNEAADRLAAEAHHRTPSLEPPDDPRQV
ncbi:hypothetical protein HPB47_022612 [Ixodes persulcatus]|uniref:Uncharacterized protein n=1 Tax=Ixodes persulcatus TaxID=34615 RepID=A0AC60QAA7_IXOPE|nr:hypothetical protein HPB47_022612 [Ixodes persulcatus]